jgi:hypothetical protein
MGRYFHRDFWKVIASSILSILCLANPLHATSPPPESSSLPDFDHRKPSPSTPSLEQKAANTQLRQRLRSPKINEDPLTGSPNFVGSTQQFLTGPNGAGLAIPTSRLLSRPPNETHRTINAFLDEYRPLYGHGSEALTAAQSKRDYTNRHNGLRSQVWQQQIDGVPVFNAILQAHTTKKGELVNLSSHFLPDPLVAANRGNPNRLALLANPTISAPNAITIAAQNIGEIPAATTLTPTTTPLGSEKKQSFSSPNLRGATARLSWLPLDKNQARLCWDVTLTGRSSNEMFRILVDASTGQPYLRHCLTNYISEATYRVFTGDSPTPFQPGHSTPSTTQPAEIPRSLVTLSALDTTASPNGWINDGITETIGNNVDAHLDLDANNVADTPRPQGSGLNSRVFDFPLDLTLAPSNYRDAAVTQLFYWCNWMHDKLYQLGFNEASGNFQTDNFGRGGAGNDAVQADTQDGSGTNNANFSTPSDGGAPRMQMYTFSGPTPDRDGNFDATIVLHEYAHGLSNRLVGGGAGISALASQGMGEGWSDFYALALLSKAEDDPNANYIVGGYATLQFSGLTQNYYYGIRRYPCSTDLTKNPLTLRDIDPTQASIHNGIPRNPVIGSSASEVHNSGEVWCVALWDARANLIAKHGFATGNQLILQLVTDGMKLSPANPNFLQARDAILQADLVNNAGANQPELWAAFAKRGMGASATTPSSFTTTGVSESFDLPDDLSITPSTEFTANGPVGGPFTPASTTYTLKNTGASPLNWSVSTPAPWLALSPSSGSLAPGASSTLTVSLSATANSLPVSILTENVVFTNLTSTRSHTRKANLNVGQPDYFTELFDTTNNDVTFQSFTFTPNGSPSFYSVTREPATAFPSNTTSGATTITTTDDSSTLVNLAASATAKLYGSSYSSLYIGSNGYITFGSSDIEWTESLTNHFSKPRVAALFRDLNPPVAGGSVKYRQFSDRLAVTWLAVREYGTVLTNNLQIELFFDGRIRITRLACSSTKGLIGLSQGLGLPAGFSESNFSDYPLASLALSLPAQATEGGPALTNLASVSVNSSSPLARIITLTSSDPASLTVPASVTLPADQFSVSFTPTVINDSKINGSRPLTITATATNLSPASQSITILDNESTQLSLSVANLTEGSTASASISISGTLPTPLVVNLSSINPSRLAVPSTVTIPAGSTSAPFTLSATENALSDGDASILITASATSFLSDSSPVTVTDNDVHHFIFDPIPTTQIRNAPFTITVRAVTASGLPAPSFNNLVNLSAINGANFTPNSLSLVNGVGSVSITPTSFSSAVSLLASDADLHSGSSNSFLVTFGELHHFSWKPITPDPIADSPFPIHLTARDSFENPVTTFTGSVSLDCGTPSDRSTPISPSLVGPFIDGMLAIDLTSPQVINSVTLRATSGSATGQSAPFNLLGYPVLTVSTPPILTASGNFAGPFSPPSQSYTLTNSGSATLVWSVSTLAPWLSFSTSSGSLPPGSNVTVTATINAPSTDPGLHPATIFFSNDSNSLGSTSQSASLTVLLPPPTLNPLPPITSSSTLSLSWNLSPGADSFEAQSSSDPAFSSPSSSGFIPTTTFSFTNLPDGTHYYRVRSRRVSGPDSFLSPWSSTQSSLQAASGPAIFLSSPNLATSPSFTVSGSTFDSAGVASLSVNGVPASSSDAFSHWSATIPLSPGPNPITILATNLLPAPLTSSLSSSVYLATLTTDFDSDGLPDLWEIQHSLDYLDPSGQNGPLGDLSHNGIPNLLKYAFNLDPLSPSLTGLPITSIEVDPLDSLRYLTLRYRRLLSLGSLQYQIQTSLDLQSWSSDPLHFEELPSPSPNPDLLTETVTIRLQPSLDSPSTTSRFLRIQILAPSPPPP